MLWWRLPMRTRWSASAAEARGCTASATQLRRTSICRPMARSSRPMMVTPLSPSVSFSMHSQHRHTRPPRGAPRRTPRQWVRLHLVWAALQYRAPRRSCRRVRRVHLVQVCRCPNGSGCRRHPRWGRRRRGQPASLAAGPGAALLHHRRPTLRRGMQGFPTALARSPPRSRLDQRWPTAAALRFDVFRRTALVLTDIQHDRDAREIAAMDSQCAAAAPLLGLKFGVVACSRRMMSSTAPRSSRSHTPPLRARVLVRPPRWSPRRDRARRLHHHPPSSPRNNHSRRCG
mmetsp:Transcript_29961/g.79913  ORF Transcript_29961/g.79913 Transcript_29961/m.79913 type:complete len:287 (-) Transcript_29961:614-1474(-)